jgi:hypothetical protein
VAFLTVDNHWDRGAAVANVFVSPARDDLPPPDKPAQKRLVAFSEDAVCLEMGPECPGIWCDTERIANGDQFTLGRTAARGSRQSATDKDEGDGANNFVGFLKQRLASITPSRSLKILPNESGDLCTFLCRHSERALGTPRSGSGAATMRITGVVSSLEKIRHGLYRKTVWHRPRWW